MLSMQTENNDQSGQVGMLFLADSVICGGDSSTALIYCWLSLLHWETGRIPQRALGD